MVIWRELNGQSLNITQQTQESQACPKGARLHASLVIDGMGRVKYRVLPDAREDFVPGVHPELAVNRSCELERRGR